MPPRLGYYERLGVDIHGVLNGPRWWASWSGWGGRRADALLVGPLVPRAAPRARC